MAVRQLKENIGKNFAYFFYILFFAVFLVVSSTTNCLSKWDAGVLVDFVGIKSEFKTKDNLSYMNYKLKKMLADSILKTKNSLYFEILDNLNLEHVTVGTKEPILNAFQIDYLLKIKRYTKCQGLFTNAVFQGVNPYLFLSKETLLNEKSKIKSYYLQAITNRKKYINWDYYSKMLDICYLDQKFRKNVTPENRKNDQFNKRIKEIDEKNFIKFLDLINSNGLVNSKSYDTSFNGSNIHYNYIALVVHFTPIQKEIILSKIRLLIHKGLASWSDYSQIVWFSFWREPLKEANGRKYFNFNAVKLNENLTIDYLNSFINLNIFTESYLRKHKGRVSFYPNHNFVKASRYSVIVESLTNYFIKNKVNRENFSFNNKVEQNIASKSLNLLNYSIDNKCRISFDEEM